MIASTLGAEGFAFTSSVYVAFAASHRKPAGLLVVTVMITVLPASPAAGVYVNVNGFVPEDTGLTLPMPFSVIVTLVALPPKVLPLIVTGVVPHVLPLMLLSVTAGGLAQPHDTEKLTPVVVHPDEFLTVIVWLPLATLEKDVPLRYAPPYRRYSRPVPVGLITVTTAWP